MTASSVRVTASMLVFSAASALAALACDQEPGPPCSSGGCGGQSSTGATTTSTTSSTTVTGGTSGSTSGATTTTSGGDPCLDGSDCGACPTQNECVGCCDAANPSANIFYVTAKIEHCICAAGTAPCATACMVNGMPSPACADPNAAVSQPCVSCITNLTPDDPCNQAAAADCQADVDCSALTSCYQGC